MGQSRSEDMAFNSEASRTGSFHDFGTMDFHKEN